MKTLGPIGPRASRERVNDRLITSTYNCCVNMIFELHILITIITGEGKEVEREMHKNERKFLYTHIYVLYTVSCSDF